MSDKTNEKDFLAIVKEVQSTKKSYKTYPSVATDYLGVARRGWRVVENINQILEAHNVICEPDFGSAWFYGEIIIKPKPQLLTDKSGQMDKRDPTPRVSLLKAANLSKLHGKGQGLVSVRKETSITEAITLMILNDFSQLPVLSGVRDVDGIISWRSIGRSLALEKKCTKVADCIEEVMILDSQEPLFSAVKYVMEKEVVLIKHKDRTISGIVTTTDIGEQFIALAEPFLIIEQIESHIRRLLDKKFDIGELKEIVENEEANKRVESLSDLTFGQYLKIIEDKRNFDKLQLNIDRKIVIKQLEEVRKIRNDVMHFDPDGITPENLALLRKTANFLHTISNTVTQ